MERPGVMRICHETLEVPTRGRGFYDVTAEIATALSRTGLRDGICTVFVQHTSASLVIQENADPSVRRDLERWLADLAPESSTYEHDAEGPDDMPAHLRAAVTRTSESIPVRAGRLALGTWQAVYLCEHRRASHRRTVLLTLLGT